jgi:DMSO/TMAO reductase YedYZ molybdopterin-dependent catalytic subunit
MNILPPGQQARSDFPRFGLTAYAYRFPKVVDEVRFALSGDVIEDATLDTPLAGLARVEQTCDFHCVTTWSRQKVRWEGVRFADFYHRHVAPRVKTGCEVRTVVLRGQDGYRTTLAISDLLAEDVLIADMLDGALLTVEHGAPVRLVAPAHYGYKSVKHISRMEFWQAAPAVSPAAFAFMDHPRARVALEERGRWLPGWLLRFAYRPLIRFTAARFSKAMKLVHSQASRLS